METEPTWYINSSTGLAVLKNGAIVDWKKYKKVVSAHDMNMYLNKPCSCEVCSIQQPKSRKRAPSMNASEYYAYTNQ